MEKFTILGLGWLGYPLSKKLKNQFHIKASVRNQEKILDFKDDVNSNYEVFVLNENNLENLEFLLETDYLFVNYPPSKFDDYLTFLDKIYSHEKIRKIKKIFFISSTSIYPDLNEEFTEDYEIKEPKTKIVFDAEQTIKDRTDYIFRVSGLMGYNRIAGKYYSGKEVKDSNAVVNFIHRDDVINAVEFFIKNELENGIYNLVAPNYPTKKEIYSLNCEKLNINLPIFKENNNLKTRKIIGKKLLDKGFKYDYNNPLEFS